MIIAWSTLLQFSSCSSEAEKDQTVATSEQSEPLNPEESIELSPIIQMRIEGRTEEAIQQLRLLNEKHPASAEVLIQLARSLMDTRQFPLAAFRFEQALSIQPDSLLAKEAAEAHYLARDNDSALERYSQYLSTQPDDPQSQLRYARLLAQNNQFTESLNAFSRAGEDASPDDCVLMGSLFLRKKLLPQAKYWFTEASNRSEVPPSDAWVGLLRIAKFEKKDREAENLILKIEKQNPGILESTDLADYSADILRSRRLADFIALGMDTRKKTVSELASALLTAKKTEQKKEQPVISSGSKIPISRAQNEERFQDPSPEPALLDTSNDRSEPSAITPKPMSLADAFAAPIHRVNDASVASESALSRGEKAYLEGSYTSALLFARDALKENSKSAEAWRLCSQAHFQLGETSQAEMTILEAIRHKPFNLDMRMDYLRIARETLPGKRYLVELEKVRELFPDSTEILWELARRYHVVENMPVTAAVLYRKIVQVAPEGSALSDQAKMELLKLKN